MDIYLIPFALGYAIAASFGFYGSVKLLIDEIRYPVLTGWLRAGIYSFCAFVIVTWVVSVVYLITVL